MFWEPVWSVTAAPAKISWFFKILVFCRVFPRWEHCAWSGFFFRKKWNLEVKKVTFLRSKKVTFSKKAKFLSPTVVGNCDFWGQKLQNHRPAYKMFRNSDFPRPFCISVHVLSFLWVIRLRSIFLLQRCYYHDPAISSFQIKFNPVEKKSILVNNAQTPNPYKFLQRASPTTIVSLKKIGQDQTTPVLQNEPTMAAADTMAQLPVNRLLISSHEAISNGLEYQQKLSEHEAQNMHFRKQLEGLIGISQKVHSASGELESYLSMFSKWVDDFARQTKNQTSRSSSTQGDSENTQYTWVGEMDFLFLTMYLRSG